MLPTSLVPWGHKVKNSLSYPPGALLASTFLAPEDVLPNLVVAPDARVSAFRGPASGLSKQRTIGMDESDISRLFMKVAGRTSELPDEVRSVFSILVSSTLRYRDRLKDDLEIILTVEDVRVTLDWLLQSMRTKRLPQTNNLVRLDLLKIWLDELKPYLW